jgi:hypothetical protein
MISGDVIVTITTNRALEYTPDGRTFVTDKQYTKNYTQNKREMVLMKDDQ